MYESHIMSRFHVYCLWNVAFVNNLNLHFQQRRQVIPNLDLQQRSQMIPNLDLQQRSQMILNLDLQQRSQMIPNLNWQQRSQMIPNLNLQQRSQMFPNHDLQQRSQMIPNHDLQQRSQMIPIKAHLHCNGLANSIEVKEFNVYFKLVFTRSIITMTHSCAFALKLDRYLFRSTRTETCVLSDAWQHSGPRP